MKGIKGWRLRLWHISVVISLAAIFLLWFLRFSPISQFEVVVLSALIYIMTALIYHYFDKSLTFEVVIEYILIAVLVIIAVQGVFALSPFY